MLMDLVSALIRRNHLEHDSDTAHVEVKDLEKDVSGPRKPPLHKVV